MIVGIIGLDCPHIDDRSLAILAPRHGPSVLTLMSCTEITLEGALEDFMVPDISLTSHEPSENDVDIAPWLATDDNPVS
jgi:hypothetical protein